MNTDLYKTRDEQKETLEYQLKTFKCNSSAESFHIQINHRIEAKNRCEMKALGTTIPRELFIFSYHQQNSPYL